MNISLKAIGCLFVLAVLWPMEVWAVQQHGGAEGLVAHQIGHALFVAGIGYLLFMISRSGLKGSGWLRFKIFLGLIIAWNFLTFSGHWMREFLDPAKLTKLDGKLISYKIDGLADAYFYLTRLDHLLLVPAFFFLYLSLRKWGRKK
ncbi:MAG: hypothetical protein ABFQ82_03760 [Thermodesulfobacteriota bacterium]